MKQNIESLICIRAEDLNISLEHLSKMERGKRKPSVELIVAMAAIFM